MHRSAGPSVAERIGSWTERRQARLHLEAEGERLVRPSQRVPSATQRSAAALERAGAEEAEAVELAPAREAPVEPGERARRRDPSGAGHSLVSHWIGRTQTSTRAMSTTASADATPTWRSEKAGYDLGPRAVDVLFEEIDRDDLQTGLNARVHRVPMPVRERDSVAPPGS
jgi:hypothetical protein